MNCSRFGLLMLIIGVKSICCLNCDVIFNNTCVSCTSPYSLYNGTCVEVCGYGYTSINAKCEQNSQSVSFVTTSFATLKNYTLPIIDKFRTRNNSSFIEPGNFVPTVDRGFYSDNNSSMIGIQGWVPTNDMVIKLFMKPLASHGQILQITDVYGNTYFNFYLQYGIIYSETLLISQIDSTVFTVTLSNSDLNESANAWFSIVITLLQINTNDTQIILTLTQGSKQVITPNSEFYIRNIYQWVLGSLNENCSLPAFYYEIDAINHITPSLLSNNLNSCLNDYFLNLQSTCQYCGSNCDPRVTCIDNLSCSQCYFLQCSECEGYLFNGCLNCTNSETPPYCCGYYCRTCSDRSNCYACQKSNYLFEAVCLHYPPTGGLVALSSPVVSQTFDSTFLGVYGKFQTGSNKINHFFFNSPDITDPIPAINRGLYFNTSSYLTASITLTHLFSLGMLIKPTKLGNMNLLVVTNYLLIQPFNNVVMIRMQTDDSILHIEQSESIASYGNWTFLSVSLSYSYPYTNLCIYLNNQLTITTSLLGVFRTGTTTLNIGVGTSNLVTGNPNYQGFVYNIFVWNSPIFDFSSSSGFTTCGPLFDNNCMWDCDFNQYFDYYAFQCYNCDNNCTLGCITSGSCNICDDSLCTNCSDFGPYSCFNCTTNAYLISGDSCACNDNTAPYQYSCPLCYYKCATCTNTKASGCTSCADPNQLLVEGICAHNCPSGFFFYNYCINNGFLVVDANFYNVFQFGNISSTVFFGIDHEKQDPYDPVPTPGRGYYFFNYSIVTVPQKMIFSRFSFSFWIKVLSNGSIFSKNNKQLVIYAYSGMLNFRLLTETEEINLSTQFFSIWEFYTFTADYEVTENTMASVYRNKILLATYTTQNISFYFDTFSDILIGDNSTSGFTGFLLSFSIYNDISDNYLNFISGICNFPCEICLKSGVCMSNCSFGYGENECLSPCSGGCLSCYSSSNCSQCYNQINLVNGLCACDQYFYWNSSINQCYFPCFQNCLDCNHFSIGNCYLCQPNYFFIHDVCTPCPTGYNLIDFQCIVEQTLVFELIFDRIDGKIVDSASQNIGIAGFSQEFYPNYDKNDPYYAYKRGYYFNGISSIIILQNVNLILSPEFTFEFWLNPFNYTGCIISKQSNNFNEVFKICLSNTTKNIEFTFSMNIKGSETFTTSVIPAIFKWSYIKIASKSLGNMNFQYYIYYNNVIYIAENFEYNFIIETQLPSYLAIGSIYQNKTLSNFFNGFIYQIRISNVYDSGIIQIPCKSNCQICSVLNECLSDCEFNQFSLNYSNTNCSNCPSICTFGCRDSRLTCLYCDDMLCIKCQNLSVCDICASGAFLNESSNQCECNPNYVNLGYYCEECIRGVVINNTCVGCLNKCNECTEIKCTKCIQNSVNIEGQCYCELGYFGENSCDPVNFYLNVSISAENLIYLDFSFPLLIPLNKSDLYVLILGSNISFTISQYSLTRYVLIITDNLLFQINQTIILVLVNKVISVNNGLLTQKYFSLNFYLDPVLNNPLKQTYYSISGTASTVATCIIVASSAYINPTPASFWSFINTIQMLIYIYLSNIQLGSRSTGYLLGLRKYQIFPNIFEYLGIEFYGDHSFQHAKDLGYKTNSILGNIGNWITCFLFFVFLYCLMMITSFMLAKTRLKQSKINEKLIQKCQGYKYGFFIRFWIQAYIEFIVACIISYYSSNLNDLNQAYNFFLSIIIGVIFTKIIILITPIVCFVIGSKKNKEIEVKTKTSEVKLWASFFYEFKDDVGTFRSQFYTIFFLRRLFFILIMFVLKDYPSLQLAISLIFVLSVFFI